jgi:hypothetical protein
MLLLLIAGIAIAILSSLKAHEFYYPEDQFGQIVKKSSELFSAGRTGRYEIDHESRVGDLTFRVVDIGTGEQIPVHEFGFLASMAHTQERRGHWFDIDKPGAYELTIAPFPTGTEVLLDFRNTGAIAGWTIGGIVAASLPIGLALLYFLAVIFRRPKPERKPAPNE